MAWNIKRMHALSLGCALCLERDPVSGNLPPATIRNRRMIFSKLNCSIRSRIAGT
jgi:hypothetical protein